MARVVSIVVRWRWVVVGLAVALTAAMVAMSAGVATASTAGRGTTAASAIQPVGELDCNGFSPLQRPVKPGGAICAEVHGASPDGQLYDNGHYIGHDEPTIQFYSRRPGSSNNITWVQTLPRDPRALPTVKGPRKDITHFFELMPSLWYSMASVRSQVLSPAALHARQRFELAQRKLPGRRQRLFGAAVLPARIPAARGRAQL